MSLSEQLLEGIDKELSPYTSFQLAQASKQLSDVYRTSHHPKISSDLQRIAYLAVRMPATHAAVVAVFEEVKRVLPHVSFRSLLDLGAGPGTAVWAAAEVFPELQQVTLLEKDPELQRIGMRLASGSSHPAIKNAKWIGGDLLQPPKLPVHDLVVFSYSLGETELGQETLQTYWETAGQVLTVIEPGTPKGFAVIRRMRDLLITQQAHLAAPCPHMETCPMTGGDWCHFSKRLVRSQAHRLIKGADLSFEDEKYSYVAASKSAGSTYPCRILRHPLIHSGHLELTLCTAQGLVKQTVSKRQKEIYRQARKAEWGDAWGTGG